MISKSQNRALLLILYIATLTSYGCARTAPATPSPNIPVTTGTSLPKPSITSTPTPDDVATAHFIETASINEIIATVQPTVFANYPSPDGKWRAEVIRYDCINYASEQIIAYEQLKLTDLAKGTEQVVADQRQNCGGLGAYGLDGLYWSPSNRYFYYSDSREGYPDGGYGNYLALPIYRLDTVTQEIMMLEGGPLSPDKTKLAMWEGNEIIIWDLDQGAVARIKGLVPNTYNGEISWSPDGQSFVYLQTTVDCAPDYGTTYVTRLDLMTTTQALLIKFEPPGFGAVSWDSPHRITLIDGDGKFWVYDLSTKETLFLGASVSTATTVPLGIFALTFYPPLIVEYDPAVWMMVGYLEARNLKTCWIGEQGPTDFNGTPPVFVPIQLGDVQYSVIFWGENQQGDVSAWYIEDRSLTGYDYDNHGLPIAVVQASASEWEKCKTLAERVLATLHVP